MPHYFRSGSNARLATAWWYCNLIRTSPQFEDVAFAFLTLSPSMVLRSQILAYDLAHTVKDIMLILDTLVQQLRCHDHAIGLSVVGDEFENCAAGHGYCVFCLPETL